MNLENRPPERKGLRSTKIPSKKVQSRAKICLEWIERPDCVGVRFADERFAVDGDGELPLGIRPIGPLHRQFGTRRLRRESSGWFRFSEHSRPRCPRLIRPSAACTSWSRNRSRASARKMRTSIYPQPGKSVKRGVRSCLLGRRFPAAAGATVQPMAPPPVTYRPEACKPMDNRSAEGALHGGLL